MSEDTTESVNPNAAIVASLEATAAKNAALAARVLGIPQPGPDADGERIEGEPATDNPDEEDA